MKRLLYSVSTETQSIWEYYRNPNTEFGKHLITGFPCGSSGKESACNAEDLSSIPGLGRPPGEVKGYPLQYSGLENSTNYTIQGVAKSQTRLSDFHFI